MRTALILGGTGFIGRHFVETAIVRPGLQLTLANRGSQRALFSELEQIQIDRDDLQRCQAVLAGRHWDHVFDFSGINYQRVLHTVATIETDHYTFLSSSAVDLATLGDPYLAMAQEKLWCEHVIKKGFDTQGDCITLGTFGGLFGCWWG